MKSLNWRVFVTSLLATLWVAAPVWGDDTDIFTGGGESSGGTPNVLFIIDTSGSMAWDAPNSRDPRIDIVKAALKQLLSEVNNINVGLMRFSNPGGPVIYPMTYIDKDLSVTEEGGGSGFAMPSSIYVAGVAAEENLTSNEVILAEGDVTQVTAGNGSQASNNGRIEQWITHGDDDATERPEEVKTSGGGSNGTVTELKFDEKVDEDHSLCLGRESDEDDNDYECKSDNELKKLNWLMGLVFPDLPVPAGANITGAWLNLTTRDANKNNFRVDIGVEAPSAKDFDDGPAISERRLIEQLVDPKNWRMDKSGNGNAPDPGNRIQSPDIKALVQAAVDDSDWRDDSGDIGFVLQWDRTRSTPSAWRDFESFESNPGQAASLIVTWGGEGTTDNYMSGFKFDSVNIPSGVTINSATLTLTPVGGSDTDVDLSVSIQGSDAPSDLSTNDRDLSSRLSGAASLDVQIAADDWDNENEVPIDVSGLIQSHVNRSGWCGGNDIVFLLENAGDARYVGAGNGYELSLQVDFDPDSVDAGTSCFVAESSFRIATGNDDAERESGDNYGNLSGNSIQIRDGGDDPLGLFRFNGVALDQGTTISEAYLEFTASSDDGNRTSFDIYVEETSDSDPLNERKYKDRDFGDAVRWDVTEDWDRNDVVRTPNIASLLNAVLGRSGWDSGNAVTFKVQGRDSDDREVYTYDADPLKAARLIVSYGETDAGEVRTVRNEIISVIDNLSPSGMTPIQGTLYEAYRYYKGKPVLWGLRRGGYDENGNSLRFGPYEDTRTSVHGAIVPDTLRSPANLIPSGCPGVDSSDNDCDSERLYTDNDGNYAARSNPQYLSPIQDQCQGESHIVFLTDGDPTAAYSEDLIMQDIGVSDCPSSNDHDKECVVELARHMHTADMAPDLDGTQTVTTHMIGFAFASDWMEEIAQAGGGQYKTANNLDELVSQFKSIVSGVLRTNTSFVAPVSAINQYNSLSNLEDVYFAVFRPEASARWAGNLKRYRLGTFNGQSNVLLDSQGQPAVSDITGFFKDGTQSYWSPSQDGADVTQGGAASQLPAYSEASTGRKIYTDSVGTSFPYTLSMEVKAGNISSLGLGSTDLIAWIRGQDVDDEDADGVVDEHRQFIGDPLHSRPVAINYGSGSVPDVTLYFGTNAGMFHAIDADDGVEQFAFLPAEMLSIQADLRANASGSNHIYGMDGSPSVWWRDVSGNGISASDSGDFARIYTGQRRGGRSYYALDVTNRNAPSLMWKIVGGSTRGFEELGQSWARPIIGRINVDGEYRDVLYLSGGYDDTKDGTTTKREDGMGRAMYIVDAVTGELIWSGGAGSGFSTEFASMKYSIPASPAVIDVDGDGIDDAFFVGDTGGQVWRFDIANGRSGADLVTGGLIGDFALTAGVANNRRFFHSPDVALVTVGGALKLAVTLGTGERPSPLATATQDRFYMLLQDAVYGKPALYERLLDATDPVTGDEANLYDATDNIIQVGSGDTQVNAIQALSDARGWYINLTGTGEKVLSTPLTFRDTVAFTTYRPGGASNSCTPRAGTSALYQLSIQDATAVNLWGNVDGTPERSYDLQTPSIVDEPVIVCTGEGCELFAGAEQPPISSLESSGMVRSYWRQDD